MNWQDLIVESDQPGKVHHDSQAFSDLDILRILEPNEKKLPQISQIDVYHDTQLVFGFEIHYKNETKVGHHLAQNLHSEVKCDRFKLAADEYVSGVEGRFGDLVD